MDLGPSCAAPSRICGDRCVDVQSSREHCGACGTACAAGQICVAGACQTTCPTGQTVCGAACATLRTDVANCGACGNACPAGQVCSDGACALVCGAGFSVCGGGDAGPRACADLQRDSANCGACGAACARGERCEAGACRTSCPPSQTACGARCSDLQSDPLNCGACGTLCGNGQACVAGVCRGSCPSPLSMCSTACVDTRYDPDHCGGCGRACAPFPNLTRTCGNGACVPGICVAGFADCNSMTVDGCEVSTTTDPNNCGGCGRACTNLPNASAMCTMGVCAIGACNAGFANCDGDAMNGCEANLQADRGNCGACGVACPGVCSSGVCTLTVHNTEAWTATTETGGCAYNGTHRYTYYNAGSMPWRECARTASRRGAMMAPGNYTSPSTGWYGHRNGAVAMTGVWSTYQTAQITASQPCVLGRDPRATRRDRALASTLEYDGQTWRYEDFGPLYYDECQLIASEAGASMITPYTLGRTGADYWVQSVIACNVYNWITAGGTNFAYDNIGSGQRSSRRNCMVGYVDN
jgi:hypothetical protein